MTSATITAGTGRAEGSFTAEDGTYPVILVSISEDITTKVKSGPRAGEDWTFNRWQLAIDLPGTELDGQTIEAVATTPKKDPKTDALRIDVKSNYYGFISAFFGKAPPPGTDFDDLETMLVGRSAQAVIITDSNDYPKVDKIVPASVTGRAAAATKKNDTSVPF